MKRNLQVVFAHWAFTAIVSVVFTILAIPTFLSAQTPAIGYWQEIEAAEIGAASNDRLIIPEYFLTFRLDLDALRTQLETAPPEAVAASGGGLELQLPNPNGTFSTFRVWNSPIMEPALAAAYPEIRTYGGVNIANPAQYLRFDITPHGFHAMTIGGGLSVFIDPYAKGNTADYQVYYKKDFAKKEADRMTCNVDGSTIIEIPQEKGHGADFVGDCGIRHEYRLALSCVGEYAVFHGGTVVLALAAMSTTMNRVNGVFERDGAIRMIIIANNNLIVYTNAATDPFSNPLDDGLTTDQNQTNIDAVIGNANYDIGHVFTNSGSGLAASPSVCVTGSKASAVTGSSAPVGDPFDIDYVAHEMGHQFSANHTQYNPCNRNNATAIEPGSASTVMGYAGICAPDVQSSSDAYFSTASIFEFRNYVATGFGSTCDVAIAVTNVSPTVTPLTNYSIPISTPFLLTAAATDPNGSLTYCWEQIDAYSAPAQTMPPAATNTTGPMFRSFNPAVSPIRYFPALPDVFSNTNPTWEELPSVGRAMNFRVTARDNFATAGCTGEAANIVTTVAAAGPFLVTSPNTAVTYAGNSAQTITWNVAGTTAAPISCANVNILLTTNAGASFTTLLSNTPNDGSQSVTMPNITTTTARIWIQCSNNIFYDVSNVNFSINAVVAPCAELFISEYIEGTSNNKAIEIFNPTASAVTLTGNYSLRIYFNGSTTPTSTIALIGTIAPYDVFVVADDNSNATILAQTDQQSTATFYNGDDAIELLKTTTSTTVDVIGQIGFDPGAEWGTGLVSTMDNTIRRKATVQLGDSNGADAFVPSAEWDGFATDDATGLGAYLSSCAPCPTINVPGVVTNVSCFGGNNGAVNISVSGGTGPYNYDWADISGTNNMEDRTGLLIGTYTVTVTDVNACTGTASFTITQPTEILHSFNVTNVTCNGGTNGAIDLTVLNGVPPNTYLWSNGATTEDISGLSAATYTVTTTDMNTCTKVTTIIITQPSAIVATAVATGANCTGPNTGAVDLTVSGGTAPYTYIWTNGATIQDLNNVPAGTYTVTVVDDRSCTRTASATVAPATGCGTGCGTITGVISGNGAFCAEGNTDNIPMKVTIVGGTGPYTVVIFDGTANFTLNNYVSGSNISRAVYNTTTFTLVSITDVALCTALPAGLSGSAVSQVSDDDIQLSEILTQPTCAAQNGGAIDLSVTGGISPYTYLWSNGATTQDLSGLSAGTYSVTTTDVGGCSNTASYTLNAPTGCAICPGIGGAIAPSNWCSPGSTTLSVNSLSNMGAAANGETNFGITFVYFNAATANPYSGGTVLGTVPFASLGGGGTTASYTVTGAQIPPVGTGYFWYAILSPTPTSSTCRPSMGFEFAVEASPTPFTVTGGGVACAQTGVPIGLSGSQSNVSYQLILNSTPVATVAGNGTPISFGNFSVAGTYTVVASNNSAGSCTAAMTGSAVISLDNLPPVITCPAPVSVSCANQVPAVNINSVTINSNPGFQPATVTVTHVGDVISNQTCPNRYTITRTYRAQDACGNSATCSQIITVNDQTGPTFNQSPLPDNLNISCTDPLPIAPNLTGTDACGGGAVPQVLWINELHYDNAGVDAGEFIEIAGTAGLNLSNYALYLYNGNGGVVYAPTVTLSGLIDNEGGSGFGALSFAYASNGIQNGAPDGIALVRISPAAVLQFISYEGDFQAIDGPAMGMMSTNIGVSELGNEPLGLSLQLTGTGSTAANFSWVGPLAQSPGTLNAGQTITAQPVSITATLNESSTPGQCAGARIVTRTWTLTDPCGNATIHTQTINISDSQPPVLTPTPPNITLSCSDPIPAPPTVIATDACDPAGQINGPIWINEIHYDNVGTDAGEFVEIAGRAGTNLANATLFFYNGAVGQGGTYGSLPLSGIIPNQSNGFGTLSFAFSPIENGSPDGIALVQGPSVVQFLSYEGSFTAVGGPANGIISTDIGVSETGSEPLGQSLRLSGNGATYAAFTWNGPSAANPATPGAVNQGQTFPVQPPVGLPVIFTTASSTVPGCPYARTITRTWSATDACNNTASYTQTITVQDIIAPIVVCQPLTVNLTINGTVVVTQNSISFTATDNCSPSANLVALPNSATYTCAQQGTSQPFVLSVRDECGNVGVCTTQVTINPFVRCVPKILISDPCVCKNNATTLTNGQFGEQIKIESITGFVWSVTAVNGLFTATSAAPPAAPTPIALGTTFTESPVGSGDYFLNGVHVDAIGYSITVRNQFGAELSIGNNCQYPNPAITSNLDGVYCLFSAPVPLTGTPGDANIVSQGFTVNGVAATQFNPNAGVGLYTIVYTVNGGVPKAFGPNDPGCTQSVSKIVTVVATPSSVACNDLVQVSLEADCETVILPDMVLEGTYGCFDDYKVELDRTAPFGNGPWTTPIINASDIGKTYAVRVTHLVSGNSCWGLISIEDKLPPVLVCADLNVSCAEPNTSPSYLQSIGYTTAFPTVTDCQSTTRTWKDTWFDRPCGLTGNLNLSGYIERVWTVTDASGNSATCLQTIRIVRINIGSIVFPTDYTTTNCTNAGTNPGITGVPTVPFTLPNGTVRQYPIWPESNYCEFNVTYTDQEIPVCDGTYKIIRTWIALDWCLPTSPFPPNQNPLQFIQVITVMDNAGPVIACPSNVTVSTDPFTCCATVNLPDVIISDNCSRINNVRACVIGFDPFTGAQIGTFNVGGSLSTFAGNNIWNPDTLGVYGITPCLPIGTHTVKYFAEDDCGNISECSFSLTIEDGVPPVVACDEFTQVGLGINGDAFINASTFDDGSYDNCGPVYFRVRRMDSNPCQSNGSFVNQAKFCCSDVNDTLTVILRVYDVDPVSNSVAIDAFEGHYNDCMVQVYVEDKIKPICTAPANVTVACETFDPSLWAYGKATPADNCCLDETKVYQGQIGLTHSASLTLFDTTCNRGTITRTFRAFDCYGNTSACTQRIVVTYNQNYWVKFPADRIVTVCDGSANPFGQPEFFGKDCELLATSYTDEVFTVVLDACYKIERTWTVINWCTYNTNLPCVYVPNPNPSNNSDSPLNLPGVTVSPLGTTQAGWAPTVVAITPGAIPTNYSTFWNANANCYQYKQIIKVKDGQDPTFVACPASPVQFCDITPNDNTLWNAMYWWDNVISSHDLCEGPSDLTITATDACSGSAISINYQLFLDLDGNGTMETVINSKQLPGVNRLVAGDTRQFDFRPVPFNQQYAFALQSTVTGNNRTASVRWNTLQNPNTYVVPELPYGTHKIKWTTEDGCGNESVCEYTFVVKDCKKPTVVCINGLSSNVGPTGVCPTIWATDFLLYGSDNCTPANQLKYSIRRSGTGTGFPVDGNGQPITNISFNCADLGTQFVELWAIDKAGNADFCETYIIIQDNAGVCGGNATIAGALKTEEVEGVESANVELEGTANGAPAFNEVFSDLTGAYMFSNALPIGSNYTVTPQYDVDPLNGVTTYDLVLISRHILGLEPLNSPYKQIAADANKSNTITTFDVVELRKVILGINSDLPNNESWRFIDKTQVFTDPTNPFLDVLKENISVAQSQASQVDDDFVGVKIGDVNGSATANQLMQSDDRTAGTLLFDVEDRKVQAGDVFTINLTASEQVLGYQFTMNLDGLEVIRVEPGAGMSEDNFAVFNTSGAVTTSWDAPKVMTGKASYGLQVRATQSGQLSQMLGVSSRITKAQAYSPAASNLEVALRFNSGIISGVGFELYQNAPNPFVTKTFVGFHLPTASEATLTLFDEMGRVIYTQKGQYGKGYNAIGLDRSVVGNTGTLYYELRTATDHATRKMIQLR